MGYILVLEIITPSEPTPPRDVVSVDVPAADGRLAVQPGHAPLVCSLASGQVHIRTEDGAVRTWSIGPGTMTFSCDAVSMLVRSATALN